jgi:hypothetical protein
MSPQPAIFIAAVASLLVAIVLMLTKRWYERFSMGSVFGIQKIHATPTPRIGGR